MPTMPESSPIPSEKAGKYNPNPKTAVLRQVALDLENAGEMLRRIADQQIDNDSRRATESAESECSDCLEVIEKLQRIAYQAVRDSVAYRWHLATRRYATFDDVEYFMPDNIDEFDIDKLCKQMAETPECLFIIRGSYDLFLHREPSVDEVDHWRSRFATGESSWIDLNTFLQKEIVRLKREGKAI